MNNLKQHFRGLKFLLVLPLAIAACACAALHAQDTAEGSVVAVSHLTQGTGSIEGRIYFPAQDRYLESVRVSIQGTDKVAFTDDSGSFFFDRVPAGTVEITAVFSGFDPRSRIVTVVAGATANGDINLTTEGRRKGGGDIVEMEKYVVVGSREELGSAIADQEQRNALNMKTVVSTDEFGINPTGNIGDFLRNLPGVESDIDAGGESRSVSLSGADADYVPVSLGGFDFASAASEGTTGRTVQLQQFSMNNISRIEVTFAPTPEHRGDALGGSVNMIQKGAFESRRARFKFATSLIVTDREFTLGRTPGPLYEPQKKAKPSWEFTYTNPVSKNFGFTVSGGYNYSAVMTDQNGYTWRGISNTYSGYPVPNVPNPYSAPYISDYSMTVSSYITERTSAAITADWRLGRKDRISLGLSYAYMDQVYGSRNRSITFSTIDFTKTNMEHVEGTGYSQAPSTSRRKVVKTWMPTLSYKHIGSVWNIEAGAGWSRADLTYSDASNGYFREVQVDRGALSLVLDKPWGARVASNVETYIQGSDTPVDYHQMSQYAIRTAVTRPAENYNEKRTYFANARRSFHVFGVPVIIKTGLDIRHEIVDQKPTGYENYTYYGPDGIYISSMNNATPALAGDNIATGFEENVKYTQFSKLFGLGDFQFLNNALLYNHYKAHPAYFKTSIPSSSITSSRHAEEIISSGYLRGDASFFNGRLYLISGMRFEQTHVTGEGPLRVPKTDTEPANWIERGMNNKKTYDSWFPSVNAVYKLWEDRIVFRGSWFKSIGRPNFAIYNGTLNIPDPDSDPLTSYVELTSGNATLKPWTAHTWRGEINYYFVKGGRFQVTAFTRDYTNRHVNTITPMTEELLSYYNLDPIYHNHFIETKINSPYKFTLRELSLYYKQALTFLPEWARGLTVSAGVTWRTRSGKEADTATGSQYAPRSYKTSLAYNRGRFSALVSWTLRERYVSGVYENTDAVEPGTLQYVRELSWLTAETSYRITKNISIFAQGNNLLDNPYRENEAVSPSTPGGAQLTSTRSTGIRFTFGLQGNF